jgi:DNA-directed RNA polymerase subunit M/transcription elongation factor TFIIS
LISVPTLVLADTLLSSGADTGVDAGARIALLCLIGLLLLTLGFLVAYAMLGRKKTPPPARVKRIPVPPAAASSATPRPAASGMGASSVGGGGGASGAIALQTSTQGPMACPACRREFDAGVKFCPQDARRLVPSAELAERARSSGSVCPRCKRAYDAGVRFCAHDAEELVPAALWETTQGKKTQAAPTGIVAKICPQCQNRYDLAMTFCSRDGAELVTIN